MIGPATRDIVSAGQNMLQIPVNHLKFTMLRLVKFVHSRL